MARHTGNARVTASRERPPRSSTARRSQTSYKTQRAQAVEGNLGGFCVIWPDVFLIVAAFRTFALRATFLLNRDFLSVMQPSPARARYKVESQDQSPTMSRGQFQQLAEYNRWANARVYGAALDLSDQGYRLYIGVFFGSLHGTLNHLLLTDRLWLRRLTGEGEHPNQLNAILYDDRAELTRARIAEEIDKRR